MKKIIILDDHCQEKLFYLLEDYLDSVKKYCKVKHNEPVEFVKCSNVKEFANMLLASNSGEYDGWIVDMMIPAEGLVNYALLGRADIEYNMARSGMLTLRAITEHDNSLNNLSRNDKPKLTALANRPALILSALREGNLIREMNSIGLTDAVNKKFFYASKAEIDVVELRLPQSIQSWCDRVMGMVCN